MTEGPSIAAMAYLGEQVSDFGEPSAYCRSSRTLKYAGLEGVCHSAWGLDADRRDKTLK